MQNIFIEVLNNAWMAGILILAVLVVRLFLKKVPRSISCILWAIVGLRLLIPLDIRSVFSLLPGGKTIETATDGAAPVIIRTGLKGMDSQVNRYIHTYSNSQAAPQEAVAHWTELLCFFWIAGILCMLCYLVVSYILMRRKVARSVALEPGVRICDEITSPFLFGLLKPCIYLPSGLEQKNREYVLSHERMHLRRRDHWWKLLGFLVLAVYWFQPLCWISYYLLCKDMELACDEMVIKKQNASWRADYCQALLDCSMGKRKVIAVPLAFGEIGVRERIRRVLQYKKTRWSMVIVAIFICASVAICFGTKPNEKKTAPVKEKKSSTESEIPAVKPTVDLSAITGADGARMYYADANTIIFGGYFGLFVYDTKQHKYIRSVDLKPIGCEATQGDNACTILVKADGSEVYLRQAGKKNENSMYVYHVKKNVFTKENNYFYNKKLFYGVENDLSSATFSDHGKTGMCWLRNAWKTIGELGYQYAGDDKVYPLFVEKALQGADFLTPDQVTDIVKAEITYEGVHYVCTEKSALKMLETGLQKAKKTKELPQCPFDDVMFLTRSDQSVGMIIPARDGCKTCLMQDGSYQLKDSMSVSIYDMIRKGYFKPEKKAK